MSPHLRGNVYVQFASEDAALNACTLFNGRWYAGRQLTCCLVTIDKWRHALCGECLWSDPDDAVMFINYFNIFIIACAVFNFFMLIWL